MVFIPYKQKQDDVDRLIKVGMREKEASKKAVSIVEDVLSLSNLTKPKKYIRYHQ